MAKIIAAVAAIGIALGALLLSRNASAAEQSLDPDAPEFVPASSGARGIQNNNPFNLEFRPSINWRGQTGADGRFVMFDTPVNGIRAGMINIHTKMTRDGLNTIRKLLNRLSPSFENPTENFIAFVSQRTGLAPDQPFIWVAKIFPLSKAIIQFENGSQPYSDAQLQEAFQETGRA